MVEVAKLVGTEKRDYTGQDGRQRQYLGLHLLFLEGSSRRVDGCKVAVLTCPPEVDPIKLKVGVTYQLDYETYETKTGLQARLVDLLPVEV